MKQKKKPVLRIKEIMLQKGMSRQDLADKAGVSTTTITNICTELHLPAIPLLIDIAKALDVDVRELFVPTHESFLTNTEIIDAKELISKGLAILKRGKS